jgi:hypothetical protein
MSGRQTRYSSYLLRLWQDNDDDRPTWRASLQSSLAGDRQVFATLDHLFAFLSRRVGPADETDDEGQAGSVQ